MHMLATATDIQLIYVERAGCTGYIWKVFKFLWSDVSDKKDYYKEPKI